MGLFIKSLYYYYEVLVRFFVRNVDFKINSEDRTLEVKTIEK